MAAEYAVVQRRAPANAQPLGSERSTDQVPLYSQVRPRAQRPADTPSTSAPPGPAPAHQSSAWPSAYEDVADGMQISGLGFNLRIGRPKGPRDPPAEWTRV